MYGIRLVIVLVIMGGAIAYVGDKIGMKVGKKRLSLLGLRPKHTSIIITILTGVLITVSSLVLLLVASENVRLALFDMQQLVERIDLLDQQVTTKDDELAELQAEIGVKIDDLLTLEEDKALLEDDKLELEEQLSSTKEEYQQVRASKEELGTKVDQLAVQREDLTQQVDNLAHNLSLFGQKYLHSLTGDIAYQKGEVILDSSLEVDLKETEIEKDLLAALETAKGSLEEGPNLENVKYKQHDFEEVVELLTEREGRNVVRLVAAQNTFKDEDLLLEFELYQDYQVYETEQLIFDYQLAQVDDLTDLEAELNQFLVELNQKVVRDGVLPNDKGEIGSLSLIHLYPVLEELLTEDVERIKLTATEDIWRSDQLVDNIELKVER
ncbi:DUF3084 domain-containing protein [Natroniella sulfidigena]|uniref:DUF3084 domain-containing protein n=1 Tax=Natroniella sulfidigena TaxID=723921 RepID=UPI00200B0CD3|nr:DUF3084 domain-containing protein [Natroniella sulfidigena]MCK8816341.1 DUF3084 domain-containing protein [Natroniella sulfidigena]